MKSMQEQKSIQEEPDELTPAEREAVEALLAVKTDEDLSEVLCKVERTLRDEAEKEAIEDLNKQESSDSQLSKRIKAIRAYLLGILR